MKKFLIAGAMIAALGCGAAMASDSEAACQEFAANNGISDEPCACIAAAVEGDAALVAEQLALVTMEDYENSSAELHAAVDPCIE
ncbi:MAG: hypothetical protein KAH44_03330 [Oricola sp.]|jgi:hypothetical protein|nr:hypothetical protein [Oricola sp.]